MNKIFLDIETIPAEDKSRTVLEFLFERKLKKKSKKRETIEKEGDDAKNINKFEDYIINTSFDGGFGRILCIAYAINDKPVQVICNPENERKTLEDFWSVAKSCDLFIGHNVMDFDLRFIYQRSIVLGVKPTKDLSFARYRSNPIFDTMKEWSKWDFQNNVGLEHIALALGLPTPKDGIDGSEVYTFFKNGYVKEICDYCMRDVETTREVYRKMNFEDVKAIPEEVPF